MKMLLPNRIKMIFLAVVSVTVFVMLSVSFTDAVRLNSVVLNDQSVDNYTAKLGLDSTNSILSQPLDSLATALIRRDNIYKVELSYTLFNRINIKTNNFRTVCLLLDQNSSKIFGVNDEARIVRLDNSEYSWDTPMMTSVSFGNIYTFAHDSRVYTVVEQLIKLKENNPDMYRLIDEIDFGNQKYLKVSIDGLHYRLKLKAETFLNDVNKFIDFVSRFDPELENVKLLDLRFDEMIISCGVKG